MPDRTRATLAVAAGCLVLVVPSSWGQIGAIVIGAVVGLALFRDAPPADHASLPHPVSRTVAIAAIVVFFVILIGLPLVVAAIPNHALQLF
jgi:chromate transporter